MPIPDFQSLMLPILEMYGDKLGTWIGKMPSTDLKMKLTLSDEEIKSFFRVVNSIRFNNRFGWATVYLLKSGLLSRPSRGKYLITPRGFDVLNENPRKINMKYLEKFPEYLNFKDFKGETIEEKVSPPKVIEYRLHRNPWSRVIKKFEMSLLIIY